MLLKYKKNTAKKRGLQVPVVCSYTLKGQATPRGRSSESCFYSILLVELIDSLQVQLLPFYFKEKLQVGKNRCFI